MTETMKGLTEKQTEMLMSVFVLILLVLLWMVNMTSTFSGLVTLLHAVISSPALHNFREREIIFIAELKG